MSEIDRLNREVKSLNKQIKSLKNQLNDQYQIMQTEMRKLVQDYETKFDNLMLVYKDVFSKTGWTMYDTVSLKFKNQVVCTRRKKW